MLEMIQGAYNGLKAAGDLAQGFIALKTEAEKNSAVIDIQRHVLDGQRALMEADALHAADLRRVSQLEQEIVRLKDWSAERERYHLVAVDRGAFAYMPKPGMEDGKPAHWLCANCFEHSNKSLMQFKGEAKAPGGNSPEALYGCDVCKGSFKTHWREKPAYPDDPDA